VSDEITPDAPDPDQTATDADQTATDADQTASDSDQTASDSDQAASDADQAASDSDQAASDTDQRAAARDDESGPADAVTAARHERSERDRTERTAEREIATSERARASEARAEAASTRDASATARDANDELRDRNAELRDVSAEQSDTGLSSDALAQRLVKHRVAAAAERAQAAADRRTAAADRQRAAERRKRMAQEISDLRRQLRRAQLDDLTQAYRRDLGDRLLSHEIDRAHRESRQFVLAYIDVDGMKQINDRDGHGAGDQVLQTVVDVLRASLRSYDPIVRYGGDEFVCGLSDASLDEAERRFDALSRTLAAQSMPISVGLAALQGNETLDALIARADAALLQVKQRSNSGRRSPGKR
jgi:diguanylate cyclase (GGDEF)-like protein